MPPPSGALLAQRPALGVFARKVLIDYGTPGFAAGRFRFRGTCESDHFAAPFMKVPKPSNHLALMSSGHAGSNGGNLSSSAFRYSVCGF